MPKLSPKQRVALETLAERGECNAHDAKLNLHTLDALKSKHLVALRADAGIKDASEAAFFAVMSPRTRIFWRITNAGRAALCPAGHESCCGDYAACRAALEEARE